MQLKFELTEQQCFEVDKLICLSLECLNPSSKVPYDEQFFIIKKVLSNLTLMLSHGVNCDEHYIYVMNLSNRLLLQLKH